MNIGWLGQHLVNLVLKGFLNIDIFGVPRQSNDPRLINAILFVVLTNHNGGGIAVHDWHGAVHEDQAVADVLLQEV